MRNIEICFLFSLEIAIISMAKTKVLYNAINKDMVSFRPNIDVRVLSKSGIDSNLWFIEVQGRRGWAPVNLLQETKMLVKTHELVEVNCSREQKVETIPTTEAPSIEMQNLDQSVEAQSIAEKEEEESMITVEEEPLIENDSNAFDGINENKEKIVKANEEPNNIRDEDDVLEQELNNEYANMEPVDEEPAVKKFMYKTGENPIEKEHVKLEVVGLNSSESTKLDSFSENNEVSESDTENENRESESAYTTNDNFENFDETQEIVLTTPVSSIEQDIENMRAARKDKIEPIHEVETTITPDEAQSENIQIESPSSVSNQKNNMKFDSITMRETLTRDTIEATSIKTTKTVEIAENIDATNETNMENLETKSIPPEIQPTILAEKMIDGTLLPDIENNFYDIPMNTEQNIASIEPSEFLDTDNETLESTESKKIETTAVLPEESSDSTNTISFNDTSQPTENVENVNEYISSAETNESDELNDVDVGVPQLHNQNENSEVDEKLIESLATNTVDSPSEQIVDSSSKQEETSTDPSPELNIQENHSNEVLTNVDEVEETIKEQPIPEENKSSSDDIFSTNFIPDVATNEVNASNWYDGIIVFFEQIYASVQKLYSNNIKSLTQKDENTIDSIENPVDENNNADEYCEKLDDGSCPKSASKSIYTHYYETLADVNYNKFANDFLIKIIEMANLVMCLSITGACILVFLLGQQCLSNNRKESELISKLNIIERKLLTSDKECSIVKCDLVETRKKLASIADKSFGTDDMIKQCEMEKTELREQITALEKELETAAEAGLELNKMLSELLNNQSGSDSIISSVEELQKQLNEQQETTVYINNLLAEKSRENSELQVLLSETNSKFGSEIDDLLKLNDQLKFEKENIETELKETIDTLETQLNDDLETKSNELIRINKEFADLQRKYDEIVSRWQISTARAESLEDSIKKLKEFDGKGDVKSIIEITNANAKLLASRKENESLKDKLEAEIDSKRRSGEQIKLVNNEISRLRTEFNQNEKDKLEAQTRLEVLSSYFKEKESQLQK